MTNFNAQAQALCLSDMYKDAYGSRPRIDFDDGTWTQEKFDTFVANTGEALTQELALEKVRDAESLATFTAYIDGLVAEHGISRAEAIRWDMQAVEADGDADFYFHMHGVSHSDSQQFMEGISR